MKGSILVPCRAGDHDRMRSLPLLMRELGRQARATEGVDLRCQIHVNGVGSQMVAESVASRLRVDAPVLVTNSEMAGKPAAVRFAAQLARDDGSDVLVVVDNDVVLPPSALRRLLAAYRTSARQSAYATKAPHLTLRSTSFQSLYGYAVQESFRHTVFPKRPSGSFYAVDPWIVDDVLAIDGSDSRMLNDLAAARSDVTVFSAHADSFSAEVTRRKAHYFAAERNGYRRFHAGTDFAVDAVRVRLPASVDRDRFERSIRLWNLVHRTADGSSRHGQE